MAQSQGELHTNPVEERQPEYCWTNYGFGSTPTITTWECDGCEYGMFGACQSEQDSSSGCRPCVSLQDQWEASQEDFDFANQFDFILEHCAGIGGLQQFSYLHSGTIPCNVWVMCSGNMTAHCDDVNMKVGCTDPTANNYDPDANVGCYDCCSYDNSPPPPPPPPPPPGPDDSTLDPDEGNDPPPPGPPIVYGCTDNQACNHDFQATIDDGSCLYHRCNEFPCTSNLECISGVCSGYGHGSVCCAANELACGNVVDPPDIIPERHCKCDTNINHSDPRECKPSVDNCTLGTDFVYWEPVCRSINPDGLQNINDLNCTCTCNPTDIPVECPCSRIDCTRDCSDGLASPYVNPLATPACCRACCPPLEPDPGDDDDDSPPDVNPNECVCDMIIPDCDNGYYDCVGDGNCLLIGDVNGDGQINVLDVVALVNQILDFVPDDLNEDTCDYFTAENACCMLGDITDEGIINILDVIQLINCILDGDCGWFGQSQLTIGERIYEWEAPPKDLALILKAFHKDLINPAPTESPVEEHDNLPKDVYYWSVPILRTYKILLDNWIRNTGKFKPHGINYYKNYIVSNNREQYCETSFNNCDEGYDPICYEQLENCSCVCGILHGDIVGCTDESACNYNPDANTDPGNMCWYNTPPCECADGSNALPDCSGACNGSSVIDDCGVCDGGNVDMDPCGNCFTGFIQDTDGNCCSSNLILAHFNDTDCDGMADSSAEAWLGCFGLAPYNCWAFNQFDTCEGTDVDLGVVDSCGVCFSSADPNDILGGTFPMDWNACVGCTDPIACNSIDMAESCEIGALPGSDTFCIEDGSCEYADIGVDCDGNCILETSDGCECGELLDECGVCDGGGMLDGGCSCDENGTYYNDCNAECGGDAEYDECGECGGDGLPCTVCDDPEANPTPDCTGDCYGNAYINECGECNTEGLHTECVQGCDGNWYNNGAPKTLDSCDICDGPNTDCSGGYDVSTCPNVDCAGVCFGSSVVDPCGECGGSGVVGCPTDTACNYESTQTCGCDGENGTDCCITCHDDNCNGFPSDYYDCDGNCINDNDYGTISEEDCATAGGVWYAEPESGGTANCGDGICDNIDDCVGEWMECGCDTPWPTGDGNDAICNCEGDIYDVCGVCGGQGIVDSCGAVADESGNFYCGCMGTYGVAEDQCPIFDCAGNCGVNSGGDSAYLDDCGDCFCPAGVYPQANMACGGMCTCNFEFNGSQDDCGWCPLDENYNLDICVDLCGVAYPEEGDEDPSWNTTCCIDDTACNYTTADACVNNQVTDGLCCLALTNYDCDGNCIVGGDCAGTCGGQAGELICYQDSDGDGLGDTSTMRTECNTPTCANQSTPCDLSAGGAPCPSDCAVHCTSGWVTQPDDYNDSNYCVSNSWDICGNCITNDGMDCIEFNVNCPTHNGSATHYCNCSNHLLDACGVCNGDGSLCTGCTDEQACNYDANATITCNGGTANDCCLYPIAPNDCGGNCCTVGNTNSECDYHGQDYVFGCLDDCGVSGTVSNTDECGVCRNLNDGDWNLTCTDCAGYVNGTSFIDDCGNCVCGDDNVGTPIPDDTNGCVASACTTDCTGTPGGTNILKQCCDYAITGIERCLPYDGGTTANCVTVVECGCHSYSSANNYTPPAGGSIETFDDGTCTFDCTSNSMDCWYEDNNNDAVNTYYDDYATFLNAACGGVSGWCDDSSDWFTEAECIATYADIIAPNDFIFMQSFYEQAAGPYEQIYDFDGDTFTESRLWTNLDNWLTGDWYNDTSGDYSADWPVGVKSDLFTRLDKTKDALVKLGAGEDWGNDVWCKAQYGLLDSDDISNCTSDDTYCDYSVNCLTWDEAQDGTADYMEKTSCDYWCVNGTCESCPPHATDPNNCYENNCLPADACDGANENDTCFNTTLHKTNASCVNWCDGTSGACISCPPDNHSCFDGWVDTPSPANGWFNIPDEYCVSPGVDCSISDYCEFSESGGDCDLDCYENGTVSWPADEGNNNTAGSGNAEAWAYANTELIYRSDCVCGDGTTDECNCTTNDNYCNYSVQCLTYDGDDGGSDPDFMSISDCTISYGDVCASNTCYDDTIHMSDSDCTPTYTCPVNTCDGNGTTPAGTTCTNVDTEDICGTGGLCTATGQSEICYDTDIHMNITDCTISYGDVCASDTCFDSSVHIEKDDITVDYCTTPSNIYDANGDLVSTQLYTSATCTSEICSQTAPDDFTFLSTFYTTPGTYFDGTDDWTDLDAWILASTTADSYLGDTLAAHCTGTDAQGDGLYNDQTWCTSTYSLDTAWCQSSFTLIPKIIYTDYNVSFTASGNYQVLSYPLAPEFSDNINTSGTCNFLTILEESYSGSFIDGDILIITKGGAGQYILIYNSGWGATSTFLSFFASNPGLGVIFKTNDTGNKTISWALNSECEGT